MNRSKKRKKIYALILLLSISIGYALLSTTLNINGVANINANTWNIHWDRTSIQIAPESTIKTNPTVSGTNDNTVEFSIELEMPGDYYEFYVDAINEGTIDGEVDTIVAKTYNADGTQEVTLPSYLLYQVVYGDTETVPQKGDILQAGKSKTYKVRVEYDTGATTLPSSNETYKFSVQVTYIQGKVRQTSVDPRTCEQFTNDSWSTIKKNVDIDPQVYPVGCTKEVDLGTYGTHTVRVANNTNPSECSTEGFSQTACGFVLEFTDSITSDIFNNYDSGKYNGDGNYGGWKYSLARTHVNTDIYNALPTALKNTIIDTKVISSHGPFESINYETTDKLYLLDSKEVHGSGVTYNTITNLTRQLDYYNQTGISAIKQYNNSNSFWWLRTADSGSNNNVFAVTPSGTYAAYGTASNAGFSPAFRIGTKIDDFDTVSENNTSVKTNITSDTSCNDSTPPKCNLNYVTTFNSGFRYSFSCTDDNEINRIASLFDHDPYNGQYNSSSFSTIGTVKNGTVINNGKTKAYTSQWTTANPNPPSKSTCYYFVYGGEDKCGNWVAYHTPICYQY